MEFHLATAGELIDLLRSNGFAVETSRGAVQAPEGADTHAYYDYVTADWARKWPAEEIWAARKTG